MLVSAEPLNLALRRPFRIAHGVSATRENVLVRVDSGVGEAACVPYYGETQRGVLDYLRGVNLSGAEPGHLEELLERLPPGSTAARAGIDIALHDLWGKTLGQPLYRLFGLNPASIPETSVTIAMDSAEAMAEQASASDWPILKLKLGGPDDVDRLRSIRRATKAKLRVDVNGGWSREEAARMLPILADFGVELVEQPLATGDVEGSKALMRISARPRLFADESVRSTADLLAHAGAVDGVVLKLAKSGGIRATLRQIAVARALGMDVMLGCMIESSIAVTAAAHIAPLAQHVDLDGPTLIEGEPLRGVRYERGRLVLSTLPGLGLEPGRVD